MGCVGIIGQKTMCWAILSKTLMISVGVLVETRGAIDIGTFPGATRRE
jgi:hypothetical protein